MKHLSNIYKTIRPKLVLGPDLKDPVRFPNVQKKVEDQSRDIFKEEMREAYVEMVKKITQVMRN